VSEMVTTPAVTISQDIPQKPLPFEPKSLS